MQGRGRGRQGNLRRWGRQRCRNVIMHISHLLSSRSIISWGLVIFYWKKEKEKGTEMLDYREEN